MPHGVGQGQEDFVKKPRKTPRPILLFNRGTQTTPDVTSFLPKPEGGLALPAAFESFLLTFDEELKELKHMSYDHKVNWMKYGF